MEIHEVHLDLPNINQHVLRGLIPALVKSICQPEKKKKQKHKIAFYFKVPSFWNNKFCSLFYYYSLSQPLKYLIYSYTVA